MERSKHYKYLQQAIELSSHCVPCSGSYRVGAVVVTANGRVFGGYTHRTAPTNHAEEEAIAEALAGGATLRGATMYASMEPCSTRKSKSRSCTQLILEHGFSTVVFALYEPACFVECHGAEILRAGGVEVVVIEEMADAARAVNAHLLE